MSKRKKWVKRIAFFLLAFLVIYACVLLVLSFISSTKKIDYGEAAGDACDWMSKISDDRSLAAISIPGTHDTCTQYSPFDYCFQCQETSVEDQLNMGYRFLDIRIHLAEADDGTVTMYLMHGIGHCRNSDGSYMTFQDFEETCQTFLAEHPTETIIVLVDTATNRSKNASETDQALHNEIDSNSKYWYTKNEIPTMGQVRGKMLLATRYGDVNHIGQNLCGWDLEWDGQSLRSLPDTAAIKYSLNDTDSFYVQNWYKQSVESKWNLFKQCLDGDYAKDDTLLINYLPISTEILFLPCPKTWALKLNAKFDSYEMVDGKAYGIVIFDFATADMAKKVYETNF